MQPLLKANDKKAKRWIIVLSAILFIVIVLLDSKRFQPDIDLPFSIYTFAFINSIINSFVTVLLIIGLILIKQKNIKGHRNVMIMAIIGSILFLISYVMHHLFADKTSYGGDGILKMLYYFFLITHIILAAVIMPFILWTSYKGLTGDYEKHAKIARITWPLWLYVSITGVVIYWMISPYY